MKMLKYIFIASLAVFPAVSQAQTIMIRGATVHTMGDDGILENTDVFITLLDGNENEDEKYLNELYAISDEIQKRGESVVKLYKIYLSPEKDIKQPAIFKPLAGYAFYELIGRSEKIKKIDFNNKDQNTKAWNLLLDLAFDFKAKTEENNWQDKEESNKEDKYIYITRCSSDLYPVRDELKRDLKLLRT